MINSNSLSNLHSQCENYGMGLEVLNVHLIRSYTTFKQKLLQTEDRITLWANNFNNLKVLKSERYIF
uniref:Uncharacterized protein n=1 Tax=Arundo donax TaxID=35708 RepID=A0A0A9D4P8_ARUDO